MLDACVTALGLLIGSQFKNDNSRVCKLSNGLDKMSSVVSTCQIYDFIMSSFVVASDFQNYIDKPLVHIMAMSRVFTEDRAILRIILITSVSLS